MKRNCWEYKGCGREAGGRNAGKMGVCPAYAQTRMDGMHGGRNSGRVCWVIAGTFSGGRVQCVCADNGASCLVCDFYKTVRDEEHLDFHMSGELIKSLVL